MLFKDLEINDQKIGVIVDIWMDGEHERCMYRTEKDNKKIYHTVHPKFLNKYKN